MATMTFYPDANPEGTSVDGRVFTFGASTDWATVHDATAGDAAEDGGANVSMIFTGKDGSGNFQIGRAFFLFDTSALGAGATINSATLAITTTSVANGDNDGDDWINVVQSSPASNTALVVGDYDQCGAVSNPVEGATRIDIGSLTASGVNTWTLNATGLSWINKTGITKLGMREGHDCLNSAYAGGNNTNNILNGYFADQAGTGNDPALTVDYTPGVPLLQLLGVGI